MSNNEVNLDIDTKDAVRKLQDMQGAVEHGVEETLNQLVVAAEGPLKSEAPTGAGREPHMRDTIETEWRDEYAVAVGPKKKASDGELLAAYVVGDPSYSRPPPIGPLADWADAKLGDASAAYAIQKSIAENGQESFPDPFVDRAINSWEGQVNRIASKTIAQALRGVR